MLSDFVYSFFEHNMPVVMFRPHSVVNCFQILYIRSLNTIEIQSQLASVSCELLSDFVYSFFEHNKFETKSHAADSCELLSDFVYSFFEHNSSA